MIHELLGGTVLLLSILVFGGASAHGESLASGSTRESASKGFSFENPAGPIAEFTAAQIQAQYEAGESVVPMVLEAFNSGADSVRIPPGDYRFPREVYGPTGVIYPLEFSDLQREGDDPFTIDATGATFWFDLFDDQPPAAHFTVGFKNCSNIVFKGATIDGSTRGAVEGQITQIDFENNRIEIQPVPGTTVPAVYRGGGDQRVIPFKEDGRYCAPLYIVQSYQNFSYLSIEPSGAGGRHWVNMKTTALLETISDPAWIAAYGDPGVLRVGDGLSCVYTATRAIELVNCRKMTMEGIHVYLTKGGCDEFGGYGDHLWKDCYMGPRPGSSQWHGGEGFLPIALRHGSTYDNVTIMNTADDVIDLHGIWGVVESVAGNTMTLAPPSREFELYVLADVVPGDRVLFYDRPTKELLGEAAVTAVQDKTVTLDRPVDGFAGAITAWPEHECAGWVIQNCHWHDIYQRLLIMSGPGVIRNSRFERFGHSVVLFGGEGGIEGTVPHDITITNNVFIDVGPMPNPAPDAWQWEGYAGFWGTPEGNAEMENVVVKGNDFVRSCINIGGVAGGEISGNRIDAPLDYAAVADPRSLSYLGLANSQATPQRQAIFLRRCSGIRVDGNVLSDPAQHTTPHAVTSSRILGIDTDCVGIMLDGKAVGESRSPAHVRIE